MKKPLWAEVSRSVAMDGFNKISQREVDRINAFFSSHYTSWTANAAFKSENKSRNRYSNVFPWDKTRVHLPVISSDSLDYINASYIKVANSTYIATQGPLKQTVSHFWAMCFNEAVKHKEDTIVVAMVTPLLEDSIPKCFKYWPSEDESSWDFTSEVKALGLKIPDLKITYSSQAEKQNYTITELDLCLNGTTKTVYHMYFHGWNDSKVPPDPESLVQFLEEMREIQKGSRVKAPIVHCSAGVGRTGTFIAMDFFLSHPSYLQDLTSSDAIFDVFKKLRDDRIMMIQTPQQLLFLYEYFRSRLGYD